MTTEENKGTKIVNVEPLSGKLYRFIPYTYIEESVTVLINVSHSIFIITSYRDR